MSDFWTVMETEEEGREGRGGKKGLIQNWRSFPSDRA